MKLPHHNSAYQPLSDQQLIEKSKTSEKAAITGELYRRYAPLVMGTCLKYLKNEEASKDAVMAIFERILHRLHEFKIQNFNAWLYQVTRNYCLMELRQYKSQQQQHALWEQEVLQEESVEKPEELHLTIDTSTSEKTIALLNDAVKKLKPEQRECIELFYLENKSYQVIASETGYSLKQVKSYLQNGKKNLQKMMVNPMLTILLSFYINSI